MQVNLTAMIDVVFQLLIYFVVTANFMLDEGVLTAKLPQGAGAPPEQRLEPPPQPLEIKLSSTGSIGVNIEVAGVHRASSFTELADTLASLQYDPDAGRTTGAFKPDDPLLISPAGEVRWQHVVNAFNAAVQARYTNVRFTSVQNPPSQ